MAHKKENPDAFSAADVAELFVFQEETSYLLHLKELYLQIKQSSERCGCKQCLLSAKNRQQDIKSLVDQELQRLNPENFKESLEDKET